MSVPPDTGYYLDGEFDFGAFEGQRVYATGRIVFSEGTRLLRVQSLEAADESNAGRKANFELKVEGMPPSGEAFYAYALLVGGGLLAYRFTR